MKRISFSFEYQEKESGRRGASSLTGYVRIRSVLKISCVIVSSRPWGLNYCMHMHTCPEMFGFCMV